MHFKAFIAFIFLTVSGYANAHEMNPARLILQEEENANYLVTWMFPSSAIGLPAEVSFPDCEMEKDIMDFLVIKIKKFLILIYTI